MFTVLLYTLAAIFAAIFYISRRKFDHWKKRKVPHIKPTTIFGNYGDYILQRKHHTYVIEDICAKFPEEPYIGTFWGTEPALLVRDPELLKLITTKDFYYFNGRETSDYAHKEFFTKNLFSIYGDEWKALRQNLTPVFTSSKMRNMFYLIAKCSYELEDLIDAEAKMSGALAARPFMMRFTMACIVSCAFGVDSDTMGAGYKENPFTKSGELFFSGSKVLAAKATIKSIWPGLFYGLGFQVSPLGVDNFIKKFVTSVFESRQCKPSARNDFVDFILTFKQNKHIVGDSIGNLKNKTDTKKQFPVTDDMLASQCMLFFLAGFETSATTTSYTLFELAKHPEAQKKVQEEIDAYLQKYDNKLTYDVVNELPYTYACVEEAMRLYPVLVNITREVVEDYTLPTGLRLEKGMRIHIPVYNMHKNPKYFPDPDVYRPERFLGEEKRNIIPYSYMPFGEGSRICIGMRFAKMQVLAGMVTLLKKYSIQLDETTPEVLKFVPQQIIPTPESPLKVKITPRAGWEGRQFVRV